MDHSSDQGRLSVFGTDPSPRVHDFFEACIRKRLTQEKFGLVFTAFHGKQCSLHGQNLAGKQNLLHGRKLADSILASKPGRKNDPRLPLYVLELVSMKYLSVSDVLSSLLPRPTFYDQNLLNANDARPTMAAMILQLLILEIPKGLLKTDREVLTLMHCLNPWISMYPSSDVLGYLVSVLLATDAARKALSSHKAAKGPREAFGRSLVVLINQTMQNNIQLATTLDFWQKQYNLIGDEDIRPPNTDIDIDTVNLGSLTFQVRFLGVFSLFSERALRHGMETKCSRTCRVAQRVPENGSADSDIANSKVYSTHRTSTHVREHTFTLTR